MDWGVRSKTNHYAHLADLLIDNQTINSITLFQIIFQNVAASMDIWDGDTED
jgi:hypothetical protein